MYYILPTQVQFAHLKIFLRTQKNFFQVRKKFFTPTSLGSVELNLATEKVVNPIESREIPFERCQSKLLRAMKTHDCERTVWMKVPFVGTEMLFRSPKKKPRKKVFLLTVRIFFR